MIEINRISQTDVWLLQGSEDYLFPSIDFKFQNTGNATAVLWKFSIEVLSTAIDLKPVLRFGLATNDGTLVINAMNAGWGTAYQCEMVFDQSVISQMFPTTVRSYKGTVESGQSVEICRLTRNLAFPGHFEALRKHFKQMTIINKDGISLTDTGIVRWKFKDENGNETHGSRSVRIWGPNGPVIGRGWFLLTGDGFLWEWSETAGMQFGSDTTYISILDPAKGSYEQTYPISRKIPPGDVERFHIMIGSPKSCHFRLHFKFFIDKNKVIESEEFVVKIHNLRNSGWHHRYKDGTELKRRLEEIQSREKTATFSDEREIEYLRRLASNYPFMTPK